MKPIRVITQSESEANALPMFFVIIAGMLLVGGLIDELLRTMNSGFSPNASWFELIRGIVFWAVLIWLTLRAVIRFVRRKIERFGNWRNHNAHHGDDSNAV